MIESATVTALKAVLNMSIILLLAAGLIVGNYYLNKFVKKITDGEKKVKAEDKETKIKI